MERHPYFDLWLHTDDELVAHFGSALQARETLHEWPLSCVHKLTLADGRTAIYKSQCGPTVEAAFYAHAHSPLLLEATILGQAGHHAQLLLPYLAAPRLEELDLSAAEVHAIGRALMDEIGALGTALPYLVDISTPDAWGQMIAVLAEDLLALVLANAFRQVNEESVQTVQGWATAPQIVDALAPGLVHEDFTADNIFQTPEGYRVIDWQRVVLGPPAIMLALLLASLDYDPVPVVGAGVVAIMRILRMRYLVGCARTWFPPGVATYDAQVADLIAQVRQLGM